MSCIDFIRSQLVLKVLQKVAVVFLELHVVAVGPAGAPDGHIYSLDIL